MARNQKLELQWIGKEKRPRLEPRILLEDPELSYHAAHRVTLNDVFDNRLIFGDNLLALKALEQEFTGKIKCIFIDPPYNTGSAFEHYEDGLEHSIWLSLMRDRLELLRRLLTPDGVLWTTVDDHESHYLKVLLDEIFGRPHFIANIVWQKAYTSNQTAKHISNTHDHILVYAKNSAAFTIGRLGRTEDQIATFKNPDNDPRGPWKAENLSAGKFYSAGQFPIVGPLGTTFLPPKNRFWRCNEAQYKAWLEDGRITFGLSNTGRPMLKKYLSEMNNGLTPNTWWTHDETGSNKEASIDLKKLLGDEQEIVFETPKPEKLLKRIIELSTSTGDLVLDSFAGSGTTGAVAHKLGRRWIMVELGEHCHTQIIPRMRKVIDNTDPTGITVSADWKGGGGFRYFKLAPSLIEKDKWGNPIINKGYNADMLAEAVCKLEGFMYAPTDIYWQQGFSTERDFIYVTTQKLTREQLQALSDEVGDERTLLVCCAAFRAKPDAFANLTIKKIPHAVLSRCEWGRDDYSLQIKNLPAAPDLGVTEDEPPAKSAKGKAKKIASDDSLSLFDTAPTK